MVEERLKFNTMETKCLRNTHVVFGMERERNEIVKHRFGARENMS